jgi:hypothetical protein
MNQGSSVTVWMNSYWIFEVQLLGKSRYFPSPVYLDWFWGLRIENRSEPVLLLMTLFLMALSNVI